MHNEVVSLRRVDNIIIISLFPHDQEVGIYDHIHDGLVMKSDNYLLGYHEFCHFSSLFQN